MRAAPAPPALQADELVAALLSYQRALSAPWVERGPLRQLCAADREVVEEIGASTYGGHDYVAHVFEQWLDGEGREHFTAAMDSSAGGALAGFEVLTLYDSGETGWLEALRVHPHWRGQGLATALQSHLVAVARDTLGLARVRYTTATANVASRRLAAKCGLAVVASWALIMPRRRTPIAAFAERVRAARARLAKRRGMALNACEIRQRRVAPDELLDYAACAGRRHLLQSYWKAYDFSTQSVESLLQTHQPPMLVESSGRSGRSVLSSFSWAYQQADPLGLTVFATIYAADLIETLAHLTAQLQAAQTARADAAVIMYPPELEPELFRLGLAERCATPKLPEAGPGPAAPREAVAKEVLLFERAFR